MVMSRYKKMISSTGGEGAYLGLNTKLLFHNMVPFISTWGWETIMELIMEAM